MRIVNGISFLDNYTKCIILWNHQNNFVLKKLIRRTSGTIAQLEQKFNTIFGI